MREVGLYHSKKERKYVKKIIVWNGNRKEKKKWTGQRKQQNHVMIYVENYRINIDMIKNKRRCQKYVMTGGKMKY